MPTLALGVDPGKTTGIFVAHLAHHAEIPEWRAIDYICNLLDTYDFDIVIMEDYNFKDARANREDSKWPLDVIGAVKYVCWKMDVPIRLQWNYTKNRVKDHHLIARGWHTTMGDGHANDAARHVLAYELKKEFG